MFYITKQTAAAMVAEAQNGRAPMNAAKALFFSFSHGQRRLYGRLVADVMRRAGYVVQTGLQTIRMDQQVARVTVFAVA